jgi:Glycosyl transferase family 2
VLRRHHVLYLPLLLMKISTHIVKLFCLLIPIKSWRKKIRLAYLTSDRKKIRKRNHEYLIGMNIDMSFVQKKDIIMTLLVKDEDDILEENLIFHKSMGVNQFIITDNNSSDRTAEIIKKYQAKGWITDYLVEKNTNYTQALWVGRMIEIAISKYNPDWIINCDADEFWYTKSGNLLEAIKAETNASANVLRCYWKNMLPIPGGAVFWENTKFVSRKIADIDNYELSKHHLLNATSIPKVIHNSEDFISIEMGNHDVYMKNKRPVDSKNIVIYHYCIRNYEHFQKKVINGGLSYLGSSININDGSHWRLWYDAYLRGNLSQEYDLVIGRRYWDSLDADGYLEDDSTIHDRLLKLT